jgi:hypothetical protein
MSKFQTPSRSQPSTSPLEIPEHLLKVFETIQQLDPIECYRLGAAILQDLGVGEPSVFRAVEPPVLGDMIRAEIKPTQDWFSIGTDIGRFQKDPRMLAVALLRIACVRLVGRA